MTTLSDRILTAFADLRERRPGERIGPSWLAKRVGISPAAVSKWINGTTKTLEGQNLLRAALALEVNPNWLAGGPQTASMKDDGSAAWAWGSGEQDDPVTAYFGSAVKTPLRPVKVPDDTNIDGVITVERYMLKASAGNGEPVLEIDTEGQPNYCRSSWVKRRGLDPEKLFSIVAVGDSMEPTIPDGASLIVHRQSEIVSGKIHVICRGDQCYVKRLVKQLDGSVLIRSDNRDLYSDITLNPEDSTPVYVVGLVVSMSANL